MLDQPSSIRPHWLGPGEHTGDILFGKRKKSTKMVMMKLLPVRLVTTYFMFQTVNINPMFKKAFNDMTGVDPRELLH